MISTLLVAAALASGHGYTVQPGDTLSGIAATHATSWEAVYAVNRQVVGADPNLIFPGEVLAVPGAGVYSQPAPPAQKGIPFPPEPVHSSTPSYAGTYHGSSGMEACIISRESGGNSQVMNSTGHYGLYQFSAGTWAASGGSPADFGHASVSEQQQVFRSAVAARGYSDWRSYDGC